jgi:hypothetical protein
MSPRYNRRDWMSMPTRIRRARSIVLDDRVQILVEAGLDAGSVTDLCGRNARGTIAAVNSNRKGNLQPSILTYFAAPLPYLDAPRPGAGAAAGAANSAGVGKLPS